MPIVIQLIDVYWTKASRGAPRAALRNAVPEQVTIQRRLPGDCIDLQRVSYMERDGFAHSIAQWTENLNETDVIRLGLRMEAKRDILEVWFRGNPLGTSFPKEKRVGILTWNSWLRIVSNARVATESTWAYHKYTYNIFLGDGSRFDEVARDCSPITIFRDEKELW